MNRLRPQGLADRLLVGAAALAVGVGLAAQATNAMRRYERDSVDTRFALRGSQPSPKDIIVVAVDARTFDELGVQWPFPRSLHARLLDAMRRARARVVVYDVQFTERTSPAQDSTLIEAVAAHGRVVLATTETDSHGKSGVFGGPAVLDRIGAFSGHSGLPPDEGGVLRRLPYAIEGLVTLAVATVSAERGRPPPTPHGDVPWIDYRGPPRTFSTVSFSQALRAGRDDPRFRGRTVVVGASAPSLQDVHPTPTSGDGLMSGPEIQANAIYTARSGFPLRSAPGPVGYVLIVAMALAPIALARRRRARSALLLAGGALGAYLVVVRVSFQAGTILPVAVPALAWALGAGGAAAGRYTMGSVEQLRIRDSFRRFVPEAVIEETLARAHGSPRLGGVRLESTVMFSDLRGFTAFGERRPPEQVIDVLNRYLTRMSNAILDEGGTVVTYMGDGIMAVFGAPVPLEDHADRALRAARRMLDELDAFNEQLIAEGVSDDGFRMGIGLNSGPVMSGNVGSERRLEYTALGDTTNTAARLETMSKALDRQLILADSTHKLLRTTPEDLVPIGEHAVRGRERNIVLWSIGGS